MIPLDVFSASGLGAFVESSLGARGFKDDTVTPSLLIASVTAGEFVDPPYLEYFAPFTAASSILAGALFDAEKELSVSPIEAGTQSGSEGGTYPFDAGGLFYTTAVSKLFDQSYYVVFDAAGVEQWREEELPRFFVGPVLVYDDPNWVVIWLEYEDNIGSDNIIIAHRRKAVDGTPLADVDVVTGSKIGFGGSSDLPICPSHDRLSFILQWHEATVGFEDAVLGRVSAGGNLLNSITISDKKYYDSIQAAPDGKIYGVVKTGPEHLDAYTSELSRSTGDDFDLAASEYLSLFRGRWTVVEDLLYAKYLSTGFELHVYSRDGIRRGAYVLEGNAISWMNNDGSISSKLYNGLPTATLSNDIYSTDASPYTRGVPMTPFGAGSFNNQVVTLISGPTGATFDGSDIDWNPTITVSPAIAALADETIDADIGSYSATVTCVPSNLHGDVASWELEGENINGVSDPNETWDTTVQTPVTWELTEKPAGMTITKVDDTEALLQWGAPQIGEHSITVKATSHHGATTESYTLTVEEIPATVAPTIAPLADQNSGIVGGVNISLSAGDGSITWSLVAAPAGVQISDEHETTGAIAWFIPIPGIYTITYKAENSLGSDTDSFDLTVT